jgi:hypothetical protein
LAINSVSGEQRSSLTDEYRSDFVLSYLELRRTIGIVGMSFPFILIGGAWLFFSLGPQISLSAYYHTPMGDLWVGLTFFLSGFLWSYRGYDRRDEIAGKLASVFGWLSVIFPLPQNPAEMQLLTLVHNLFAALFFATLIYFAAFLFTKSHIGTPPTPQKLIRNRIYRLCAVIMGVSLGLGLALFRIPALDPWHPLLLGETLASEAFGVAWFVKGKVILKDEE